MSVQHIDLDLTTIGTPLAWDRIFERPGPVHIDIGSGKGKFLLEIAKALPETNFLAVERAAKYHQMVCEKAAKRGIGNVRLLRTTAEDLLFRLVPESSVSVLYVLFPDPWPKKRHHKRRFIKPEVTSQMVRILEPNGRLLVKSDHPGYAEVIGEVLRNTPGLTTIDPAEAFKNLPLTGFEGKYLAEGRQIHAFAMVRSD
ncbi:MAG: tRNA (guanosine(46)-N7)-methyltransferase TrmB [Thermoanaerobaculales bacterium]|nr:tRNA (guanosine(46)-N7)-methyltransferase TrmB [Thermoanaerobaculales bacterium]